MKRYSHVARAARQEEAVALKQKALEPQCRHCYIRKIEVNILVEFPDYKGPHHKGPEGAIFCENIVECYQANIHCRYSGVSPLYPDPFLPREEEPQAGEESEEEGEAQATPVDAPEPEQQPNTDPNEEEDDPDDDWPRPRRS